MKDQQRHHCGTPFTYFSTTPTTSLPSVSYTTLHIHTAKDGNRLCSVECCLLLYCMITSMFCRSVWLHRQTLSFLCVFLFSGIGSSERDVCSVRSLQQQIDNNNRFEPFRLTVQSDIIVPLPPITQHTIDSTGHCVGTFDSQNGSVTIYIQVC